MNTFGGGRLYFAAALLALVVPINTFAVDIGGPTAEDWVLSGADAGIGVTLEAIPANEALHAYTFPGADPVFDALDRDTLLPVAQPYGLGVLNSLIWSGLPGVSSVPSEIGYYGNPAICGPDQELGANCADELRVKLDQAVHGGSVDVTFFYGSEQAGELLQVELWSGGMLVASTTEGPANNGAYGPTNPGFYTFALAEDVCWDEIRFIGHAAEVTDAADFLVEGIAALEACGLKKVLTSGPDALFPSTLIDFGFFDEPELTLRGAEFVLGSGYFNEWYRLSPWQIASSAPDNDYLAHACCGGNDQKAFQVIDASGLAMNARLRLEFDYIFVQGDAAIQGMAVGLVGIKDDGISAPPANPDPPRYHAYGGTGWDGYGFGAEINPDAVVLGYTPNLAYTEVFEPGSLEVVLDQPYDAIVVVLRADAYNAPPWPDNQGVRGFDNVRLFASDGEIDLAVEVGQQQPTFYDFDITYFDPANPFVVIEDTVPAEWHVIAIQGDYTDLPLGCGENTSFDGDYGTVDVSRGGKVGKDCESDTDIQWMPPEEGATINVQTEARCHDNRNNTKCKPTSCGALYLNYGAVAYDELGDVVAGPTAPLCLVAVSDLDNEEGIDYTGTGDEDEDGIIDWEEACDSGTDPCDADSDDDGVSDGDEIASGCMDPLNPDTDGDTISDGDELNAGTDPCDADSDDDGVNDGDDACALLGDEGYDVDGNGCPIRACTVLDNQGGAGGYTYSLLLEGDGTVASGATDAYLPQTANTPVTGSFDPNGLVDLRADRAMLDSCTPRSDYFTISASCSGGVCTGAGGFESFTISGLATCFGPADWSAAVVTGCELSNPPQPD